MTSDDLLLYVTEDYILYATDSDDKGDKIDDDVYNIGNYFGTTIYFADYNAKKGAATAFYSDGGDSFENVKSGKEFKTLPSSYYTPVSNVTPDDDDDASSAVPNTPVTSIPGYYNY
jgi:rubredoxin